MYYGGWANVEGVSFSAIPVIVKRISFFDFGLLALWGAFVSSFPWLAQSSGHISTNFRRRLTVSSTFFAHAIPILEEGSAEKRSLSASWTEDNRHRVLRHSFILPFSRVFTYEAITHSPRKPNSRDGAFPQSLRNPPVLFEKNHYRGRRFSAMVRIRKKACD